jgi:hypothetical protein
MGFRSAVPAPVVCVLLASLLPARARANDARHSETWAQASKLHERAEEERRKGDFAEACRLYEESEALDPSATTQARIAECFEHDGHLLGAIDAYRVALGLVDRLEPERRRRAAELFPRRIAALEPRVPKLSFTIPPDLDGMLITLDGRTLNGDELASPIRIDPGTHAVTATAASFDSARCDLEETEGAEAEVRIETGGDPKGCRLENGRWIFTLHRIPAAANTAAPSSPSIVPEARATPVAAPTPKIPPEADARATRRTLGWVLTGSGAVALGFGAYFGIRTLTLVSGADCDAQNRCSQGGVDAIHRASASQTAGYVAAGVGAALLSGGLALELLSAPRDAARRQSVRSVTIRVGASGASVGGAW